MCSPEGVKRIVSLDELPLLRKENVRIRDEDSVIKKLNSLVNGGKGRLQIITDYDLTITKQHSNGVKTLSSFGLLALCKNLPEDFLKKDKAMVDKYFPIEIDPSLSPEEKLPYMIKWYEESQDLMCGTSIDVEEIRRIIVESGPELRDGCVELFQRLEHEKVPVLVLSAGLGNVVQEVLCYHGLKPTDHFHVISNFLQIENGIVKGYGCEENGKFIHSLNKNGTGCSKYFEKISPDRKNVILLGDSLGDYSMDQGVPQKETVLKIGFLYGTPSHVNDSLTKYMKCFDIVLIDDQTMSTPACIIDLILTH